MALVRMKPFLDNTSRFFSTHQLKANAHTSLTQPRSIDNDRHRLHTLTSPPQTFTNRHRHSRLLAIDLQVAACAPHRPKNTAVEASSTDIRAIMAFAATRRCCQRMWHNPTHVHFAPWGDGEEVIKRVVGNRCVLGVVIGGEHAFDAVGRADTPWLGRGPTEGLSCYF